MKRTLIQSAVAVLAFTALLGLAYPLVVTGIAQVAFPTKADGDPSLIAKDTKGDRRYFQPRPSQTGYSADATFFSNRGPNSSSAAFFYREQAEAYRAMNDGAEPPMDAVTTSGSGVDPHISIENAEIQARRVARERALAHDQVMDLVREHTDGRFLGIFGEPGVNTTKLNEALDR